MHSKLVEEDLEDALSGLDSQMTTLFRPASLMLLS